MELTITVVHHLSPVLQELLLQLAGRAAIVTPEPSRTAADAPEEALDSTATESGRKSRKPRKPKAEAQAEPATPAPAAPAPAAPAPLAQPAPVTPTPPAPRGAGSATSAPTLTLDDVARTVSALLPRIGMDTLRDVLAKFKLKHVVKLTPEQFSPFLTALQEAAATIGAQPTKAAQ